MGNQPPLSVKSRQARERYRKLRRRQQALVVASGIVGCFVVIAATAIVLLLRSCSGCSCAYIQPQFARDPDDPRWAKEAAVHNFRPAPWFCEIDADWLYYATDNQLREFSYLSVPVDEIGALPLATGAEGWQLPVDVEFTSFYLGGGKLAGFREYLADPPRLALTTYRAGGSGSDWSLEIENATEGCITAEGSIIVLGYLLADGYRLAGYNLETGAKAQGMKLPLRGLLAQEHATWPLADLSLRSAGDGIVVYQKFNVAGLVDISSGRRNEYAASGYIWDIEPNSSAQVCYLLVAGKQAGTYKLRALPYSGGTGHDIYRFACAAPVEQIRLFSAGGNLMLSYPVNVGDEAGRTCIIVFQDTGTKPVLTHEFDGVLQDVASLAIGPGEFLLAFSRSEDDRGLPLGWGALQRIRTGDDVTESVWAGPRFSRPIMSLAPLKDDCLVLLRGGEIVSYGAEANAKRRLRKAKHPVLQALSSQDGGTLAIMSYTEAYLEGRPGQPMQVLVYK